MDRSDAYAQKVPTGPGRHSPGRTAVNVVAIATATSVLLSGLNALLQIVKVAIELAHHGG